MCVYRHIFHTCSVWVLCCNQWNESPLKAFWPSFCFRGAAQHMPRSTALLVQGKALWMGRAGFILGAFERCPWLVAEVPDTQSTGSCRKPTWTQKHRGPALRIPWLFSVETTGALFRVHGVGFSGGYHLMWRSCWCSMTSNDFRRRHHCTGHVDRSSPAMPQECTHPKLHCEWLPDPSKTIKKRSHRILHQEGKNTNKSCVIDVFVAQIWILQILRLLTRGSWRSNSACPSSRPRPPFDTKKYLDPSSVQHILHFETLSADLKRRYPCPAGNRTCSRTPCRTPFIWAPTVRRVAKTHG